MDDEFLDEVHNSAHGMWKMMRDGDIKQLDMLMSLVIATDPKSETKSSQYYRGIIDGIKFIKDGYCPTCKVVHDLDDGTYMKDMYRKMTGDSATRSTYL